MHANPAAIVLMGVTGCGKTAIGRKLSQVLNACFIEGDRYHPPENIERMSQGVPLSDEDRAVWLDTIGEKLRTERENGRTVVAACSALKRSYRDRLRAFVPELSFLFLDIDRQMAERRVAARHNHFMPASLVASQFETLERPQAPEHFLRLDGSSSPDSIVAEVLAYLSK